MQSPLRTSLLMFLICFELLAAQTVAAQSQLLQRRNASNQQKGRREQQSTARSATVTNRATISRAPLQSDLVEFPLPGVVSRVCVGAGGRILFLLIPDLKKLAVFDVEKAKITQYLSVSEEDVHIAAGMDKLFIASETSGTLERYDLTTLKKQVTAKLPLEGRIGALFMGSASTGPLFLCGTDGMIALNTTALTEHPFKWMQRNGEASDRSPFSFKNDVPQLLISANGRVIVNCSGGNLSIFRRQGEHSFVGVHATTQTGRMQNGIPSADGRIIYGDGNVFNVTGVPTGRRSEDTAGNWLVPAVENAFYISLKQTGNRNNTLEFAMAVGIQGTDRPVVSITETNGLDGLVSYPHGQSARLDQHLFFVPDAGLLAVLPVSKDRLFLHRIDIEQQLRDAGIDYLIVLSQPPAEVIPGQEFQYQIEARAKQGKVEYNLESAPDGMTLSADGLVNWVVPADLEDSEVNVIITLRDATGQQIFHNLKLEKCEPQNHG